MRVKVQGRDCRNITSPSLCLEFMVGKEFSS